MARYRILPLLILTCGCGLLDLPPLPKTVHIDPSFSEEERAVILDKIDMINRELGGLVGYDLLVLGDPLDDPDGFDADGSDMGDGVHGIYRVDEASEAYHTLSCIAGRDFGGYATLQDVLMIANLDAVPGLEAAIADIEAMEGWEDHEMLAERHDGLVAELEYVRWRFRKIIAHELGHHVGLAHNPREDTLMFAGERPYEEVQPGDKEAFCFVRGCDYP